MTASAAAAPATTPLPPPEVVELAGDGLGGTGESLRPVAHESLKKSVQRLCFETRTGPASVVVKRLSAHRARANQLVAERWLPAAGLGWACPRLMGVVHEAAGSAVWNIYEDVAGGGLDCGRLDPRRVGPMVELIVALHTRFAGHALLAECRKHGGNLGMDFYNSEVARSVSVLESFGSLDPPLRREQVALRDRLLRRVRRLVGERPARAVQFQTWGGPDTLLHGDLWTTNTLVEERSDGLQPRLIDWDHVGVGPVAYDLSTFLFRFPSEYRPWILGRYREAAARQGWQLPDDSTLNVLFETAEYARYACCLAEAALAASRGGHWGFEQMEEIESWFASLEPVLAVDGSR